MTRATIRTLLRRQIMEVTPQNWDDLELNDLINFGVHFVQKEVMKVDPEGFLEWVRRNITAGESFYAKPDGSWWPNQVRLLDPTSGKYTKLDFKPFDVAETWTENTVWSRRGNYLAIYPTPSITVVNGLELIHVPTLTLAADGDVPPVPIGLHLGIVYFSKMTALGETYQNYDRDVAMVSRIMGDLPQYYQTTGGENLKWRPDIVKPLGYAG